MKLFFAVDYLLHRLSAKNRHGLHSPYIYKLLDEVVYNFAYNTAYTEPESLARVLPPDGNRPNSQKVNRLLYRLVQYFNPQSLAIADNVNTITHLYLQHAAPKARQTGWQQIQNAPAECMVCDAADITIKPSAFKPGTVLMVTNIYADAAARAFWQKLTSHPNITVTADLFYLGLAFTRPAQATEHFKLRF